MRFSFEAAAISSLVILAATGGLAAEFGSDVFGYQDWHKAVSDLPLNSQDVVYPFTITPEMGEWVDSKLAPYSTSSPEVQLQILQNAFFEPGEFEFEYDQARTLTAEEAFAARHGNCMSFTSLFVTLARSAGIPTFLVTVERQPDVEMDEGLVVVNRHIMAGYRAPTQIYTYDFYVTTASPAVRKSVIDDVGASAIFHTNIGGLAIREGDLEKAVHNLEIATILAPGWAPAWVNLGVAQSRLGDQEAAFDAFQEALASEPGNSSALTNLSKLYRDQGRTEEADNAMRAAAEGTRNPFTLITMADAEILRGDLEKARRYLRRARWWYGKEPYVYDALARLARAEDDEEKEKKYMNRARELREKQVEEAAAAPN